MSPSQPIESVLMDSLRPVAAPEALWDRVWQPRMEAKRTSAAHGFAFGLPVMLATALICLVAVSDPQHSPQGTGAAIPAVMTATRAPQPNEIVSQVERRETVRAISNSASPTSRDGKMARLEANCSVCHTL